MSQERYTFGGHLRPERTRTPTWQSQDGDGYITSISWNDTKELCECAGE